jgi:hypothetical protein
MLAVCTFREVFGKKLNDKQRTNDFRSSCVVPWPIRDLVAMIALRPKTSYPNINSLSNVTVPINLLHIHTARDFPDRCNHMGTYTD